MPEKDVFQTQDFSTELESRSMCGLDWTISYHNIDDDFCTNVVTRIDGLTGECADCEIQEYTLTLDPENLFDLQNVITYTQRQSEKFIWHATLSDPRFPYFYHSVVYNYDNFELGNGESIDFDVHNSFNKDVPLCIELTIECAEEESTVEFCELVDIKCW